MDHSQAIELVKNFIEEVLNTKNYDRLSDFVIPEVKWHGTTGEINGISEFTDQTKQSTGTQAFTDTKMAIRDIFTDGESVTVRFEHTAKSVGPFFGAPPTNSLVTWTGLAIYRLDSGKIVEIWTIEDFFNLMLQLKVIKSPL